MAGESFLPQSSQIPGAVVILGELEWQDPCARQRRRNVELPGSSEPLRLISRRRGTSSATISRLTRTRVTLEIPGHLEHRGQAPLEIWTARSTSQGSATCFRACRIAASFTIVTLILADKEAGAMLRALTVVGDYPGCDPLRQPARSFQPRSFSPTRSAASSRGSRSGPQRGSERAPLYSLTPTAPSSSPDRSTSLPTYRTRTMFRARERLGVFVFAAGLLALWVGLAFIAGWVLGRMLL